MDRNQAMTFENGRSAESEAFLATVAAVRGCGCVAYEDWFTYRRWQIQGMQVQRGEKGTQLQTWVTREYEQDDGGVVTKTYPRKAYVFCRCQVKPKEVSNDSAEKPS